MSRRIRRKFTDEFKHQIVQLHNNGKPASEIIAEYDLTVSSLHAWVRQANASNSFKAQDNLTKDQLLLMKQEKELKQLRMENDILKQAALIMGRK